MPNAFPDIYPFNISDKLEVQILYFDEEYEHLIIRGTTGEEKQDTFISLDNSVCGILFQEMDKDYINCDPRRDYPERYRSYLGKKNGSSKHMKSELVIPLEYINEQYKVHRDKLGEKLNRNVNNFNL